jgi:hypothetical protein
MAITQRVKTRSGGEASSYSGIFFDFANFTTDNRFSKKLGDFTELTDNARVLPKFGVQVSGVCQFPVCCKSLTCLLIVG